MAKFQYNALKNNKEIIKGVVEAASPREAREKIRELGFIPTKVYMEELQQPSIETNLPYSGQYTDKKITFLSLKDKISFTSELEVMLSAGISILEALQTIEINAPSKKIKTVCANLQQKILSGMTFAQALTSLYGSVFGPVYISLVKAGEDAGELEETLRRMLVLLRNQDSIKGKIIRASIYPAVLILIMFGVLLLFSKFVFPAFYSVIQFNGGTIPLLSQILIDICLFFGNFWWLVIIVFCALCYCISSLFKNPVYKNKWDEFILTVPTVSEFIKYINLSNFIQVLQISYDAGLPILSGLELSGKTLGNLVMKKQAMNAASLAKNGKTLSEAFQITGLMPGELMTMVATGEKSGTLGKMLKDAANVINKKVDMALDAMLKLFEPTLIVIMGGFVLFIAMAFYQLYAGMLGTLF